MAPCEYVDVPIRFKLLRYYLLNKVSGTPFKYSNVVPEFNLYGKKEPWDIWNDFGGQNLEKGEDLYFFTKNNTPLGLCKRFRYENEKSDQHGCWIMHEYSLHPSLVKPQSNSNTCGGDEVTNHYKQQPEQTTTTRTGANGYLTMDQPHYCLADYPTTMASASDYGFELISDTVHQPTQEDQTGGELGTENAQLNVSGFPVHDDEMLDFLNRASFDDLVDMIQFDDDDD
ncbi:hypothetical protein L3X38_009206 [Prunus dulcis]|uniref:NAC domain-containing protein n=1 Tax=Prunus dulcis TaxID=3755 RepID=A0AAD5F7K5_PRUDU|nr:hypothetical protein L3X38_009206 [Prunus dulcis]